jgi:hypothetical protein
MLSLAGYVLEPKISTTLILITVLLSPSVTILGLYNQFGSLFKYTPMTLLKGLRKSEIIYLPRDIKYLIASFLVPLILRAIPELIVAPYNIGYDTISAYIPSLVALRTGFETQVYDFLYQRPFFWVVASLPYPFDGYAPFKFLPILLHGLLGVSIYIYAKETTKNNVKSLAIALLSTIYFISLRISWDLYGNEMGLILVFLSLTLLNRGVDSWTNRALILLTVIATVLTHEAASMLLFFSSIPYILRAFKQKKPRTAVNYLLILVPIFLFFIYRLQALDFPLISNPSSFRYPSQTYESLFKSVSTLYLYAILPLAPFALAGLNKTDRSTSMLYWYFGASFAALSPLYSPDAAIAFWDRWVYMTAYPLCFYAVEGVYLLQRFQITYNLDKQRATDLGKVSGAALAIVVLLISGSFLVSTPGNYQPYHTLYGSESLWIVRFVPSSMLLSTVPASWAQEAQSNIEWLNDNITEVSILFIDEELRGYAALYADKEHIILRDLGEPWYSNPNYRQDATTAAREASSLGYDIYLLSRHFSIEGFEAIKEGSYLKLSVYKN